MNKASSEGDMGSHGFTVSGMNISVKTESGLITGVFFDAPGREQERACGICLEAEMQIREYFEGKRKGFSLPIRISGTDFEKKVYETVGRISYGRVITYREAAAALGDPKKARAVGSALHRNPLPLLVPCHRVVSSDGTPGGYNGGPGIKKLLLELERKYCV